MDLQTSLWLIPKFTMSHQHCFFLTCRWNHCISSLQRISQKHIHICHDLLRFHDLPDLSSSSQNIFVLRGICHTTLWGWCLKVLSSILQMPTIFLHMPSFATMVAFEMLLTLISIMRLTPTRSTFCWSTSRHHQRFYLPCTFHHILFVLSPGFFFKKSSGNILKV